MRRLYRLPLALLAGLQLASCMLPYLTRQGATQLKVLTHRRPLEKALPSLNAEQQARVHLIESARAFALEALGLPVKGVYETYSGYHQDPIWNLSACPKDSLEPYTWRYPVMGRLPYIGFYRKADAEEEKERLLALDLDVMMYGAGAFSSLGWYSDPIVPSMLRYRDLGLVNLVIHECAHRYLFFKEHVDFNESFASFVGDYGSARYYESTEGRSSPLADQALAERRDAARFEGFIREVLSRLQAVYQDPACSREEKLLRREAIFNDARAEYPLLPMETDAYDHSMAGPLNNATLLAMRRYGRQELFDRLFDRCGQDLQKAMRIVKSLDPQALPRNQRSVSPFERLEAFLASPSPCEEPSTPVSGKGRG